MMPSHITFVQFCAAIRRKGALSICLTLFALLAITVQAKAQQIITFNAPNSGTGAYQGTVPAGINLPGTITGNVTDNGNGTHGFVRTPDGQFTDFDAPGANPVVGCTCPDGINDLGVVAGYYIDGYSVGHGFLRAPNGTILTFDAPGACSSDVTACYGNGTYPVSINNLGVVTGYYIDETNLDHGFLRTPDGQFISFEALGAGTGAFQGTFPGNINNFGVVAGTILDADNVGHAFVRTPDGKITTFEPPAAVGSPYGTYAAFINDLGAIAGSYYHASTNVGIGFVRAPDGQFTSFEAPDAGTDPFAGTNVFAVNLEGATTGYILDNYFEAHSFVRAANGTATTFDIPGQIAVPNTDAGSSGVAINAEGVIAGHWRDPNETFHGYLRLPN
jgi:hypothetical protein